jgi:hypothetical protein
MKAVVAREPRKLPFPEFAAQIVASDRLSGPAEDVERNRCVSAGGQSTGSIERWDGEFWKEMTLAERIVLETKTGNGRNCNDERRCS